MILVVLAAAALPMATAYLLLLPARRAGVAPLHVLTLAVGLGLGLSSCAFFLALLLCDGRRAGVIAIDVSLLLVALIISFPPNGARRFGWGPAAKPRADDLQEARSAPFSSAERVLAVAILIAAAASAISFLANTLDVPHGRWDAWATWNLRARWLADAGPAWSSAFAKPTIHGDYPLLLPATVARLWVYAGANDPLVPALVAAVYATALVLVLYAALVALRGRTQALVGALSLLATPLLLRVAQWQYADVPLAFNLLAALSCFALYDRDPTRGRPLLVWAGVACGLTAWTKNEGMVLVLAILVVRGGLMLMRRALDLRSAAWFAVGLLPPAAMVLYFKLTFAPRSPQFGQRAHTMKQQLLDPERYAAVLRAAAYELGRGTMPLLVGLVVYALLLGRTRDQPARGMAKSVLSILAIAAFAYGFTYLTTRAELSWMLRLSMDRLELQLWPSALLALFLYVASPSEHAAAQPWQAPRPRAKAGRHRRGAAAK